MRITIKDIAAELKLDVSTVGYALSGKGTIKDETRELVCSTAERMGYVPNYYAKSLRGINTSLVGVLTPHVLTGYGMMIQYLYRLLANTGRETILGITEFSPEREMAILKSMMELRVSCVVARSCFSSWDDLPRQHPLHSAVLHGIPVVVHGSPPMTNPKIASIDSGIEKSGFLLGRHLRETGREKIAILAHHPPPFGSDVDLLRQGLDRGSNGLPSELFYPMRDEVAKGAPVENMEECGERDYDMQILIGFTMSGFDIGRTVMTRALQSSNPPDAVVCIGEGVASGALRGAEQLNVAIPDDVAVVTTEALVNNSFSPISITSAGVAPGSMARFCLDVLDSFDDRKGIISSPKPVLIIGKSSMVS